MTVTIRQVGPCFAGEVDGIDMRRPLHRDEVAAIHAGMDRYAVLVFHDQNIDDEQQLAFTPQPRRDRAWRIGTSLRATNEYRLPHDLRRRLQPRQGQHAVRARRPPPAVRHRQPAVALRQLVQGGPGEILAAARAQHPVEGRQHRIRRHARRLRRARRGDQGRYRGPRLRALADVFARSSSASPTSPTRSASVSSRCASAWCAPIRSPAASRSTWPRMPARSSAGRCRRRAPSCAT